MKQSVSNALRIYVRSGENKKRRHIWRDPPRYDYSPPVNIDDFYIFMCCADKSYTLHWENLEQYRFNDNITIPCAYCSEQIRKVDDLDTYRECISQKNTKMAISIKLFRQIDDDHMDDNMTQLKYKIMAFYFIAVLKYHHFSGFGEDIRLIINNNFFYQIKGYLMRLFLAENANEWIIIVKQYGINLEFIMTLIQQLHDKNLLKRASSFYCSYKQIAIKVKE